MAYLEFKPGGTSFTKNLPHFSVKFKGRKKCIRRNSAAEFFRVGLFSDFVICSFPELRSLLQLGAQTPCLHSFTPVPGGSAIPVSAHERSHPAKVHCLVFLFIFIAGKHWTFSNEGCFKFDQNQNSSNIFFDKNLCNICNFFGLQ